MRGVLDVLKSIFIIIIIFQFLHVLFSYFKSKEVLKRTLLDAVKKKEHASKGLRLRLLIGCELLFKKNKLKTPKVGEKHLKKDAGELALLKGTCKELPGGGVLFFFFFFSFPPFPRSPQRSGHEFK